MDKKDGSHAHHKPGQERAISGEIKVHGGIQVFETESAIGQRKADREEDKTYKDATERYENSSLLTTRVTLVVTTLYFAVTCLIFGQSIRSANAAKSAADTARKQLEMSRPWIYSEFAPTGLLFKQDGGFLGLNITVTNTGNSIARSINTWTELWLDTRTLLSEGSRFCDIPKNSCRFRKF